MFKVYEEPPAGEKVFWTGLQDERDLTAFTKWKILFIL